MTTPSHTTVVVNHFLLMRSHLVHFCILVSIALQGDSQIFGDMRAAQILPCTQRGIIREHHLPRCFFSDVSVSESIIVANMKGLKVVRGEDQLPLQRVRSLLLHTSLEFRTKGRYPLSLGEAYLTPICLVGIPNIHSVWIKYVWALIKYD